MGVLVTREDEEELWLCLVSPALLLSCCLLLSGLQEFLTGSRELLCMALAPVPEKLSPDFSMEKWREDSGKSRVVVLMSSCTTLFPFLVFDTGIFSCVCIPPPRVLNSILHFALKISNQSR